MVTRSNILYSASAVRRMLGLFYRPVYEIDVQEWADVVWVWVPGHRPRFISKSLFKQHFVEWRRQSAQRLRVTRWLDENFSNRYTVRNETRNTTYVVEVEISGLVCTCDDFQNQFTAWGKGCCKHGYAVLAQLGFTSLQAYLKDQKSSLPAA